MLVWNTSCYLGPFNGGGGSREKNQSKIWFKMIGDLNRNQTASYIENGEGQFKILIYGEGNAED